MSGLRKAGRGIRAFSLKAKKYVRKKAEESAAGGTIARLRELGHEKEFVGYDSLPRGIAHAVHKLKIQRSHRVTSGFIAVFGDALAGASPGYGKLLPIAWIGLGVSGVAYNDSRVRECTDHLGALLRESENQRIVGLRNNFKYLIVDVQGNIVGTNALPALGRRRMPTGSA